MHDVKGVFTVLFDESLNNKLKEKQMDIQWGLTTTEK